MNASLQEMIDKLQTELTESRFDIKKLIEEKEKLEEAATIVTIELESLRSREAIRKQTDTHIKYCIAGISTNQKAIQRLILFIEDAITNKFLDPSLLFSTGIGSTLSRFMNKSLKN